MLQISRTPERWLLELLECVSAIAKEQSIDFFVVGAMARDVIFELVHNIEADRRTEDVDLGLRVSSWDEFAAMVDALVNSGRFAKSQQLQRLMFEDVIRLDIVPFGDLETQGHIQWPPNFDIEMDVAGFAEAHIAAIPVCLRKDPELVVPFATPAGLAAMKIIAWSDRERAFRSKDAEDLAFIARHYLDIEGLDRIARDFPEWLDVDFDYDLASAQLLGRDIKRLTQGRAEGRVLEVVSAQVEQGVESALAREMSSTVPDPESLAAELARLGALMSGLVG